MVFQSLLFFRTGYRSLLIHKFRSGLSVLGIVCGVMAVMSMISTGEGAKQEVLGRIEKMGLKNIFIKQITLTDELKKKTNNKKSYGLSLFDINRLQLLTPAINQIGAVKKALLTPIGTNIDITPKIIKCTGNYGELLGLKMKEGRFLSEQDSYHNNLVCVLGASLANNLARQGNINDYVRINDSLYKIVGILTHYNIDTTHTTKISNEDVNNMIFLPLTLQINWNSASPNEDNSTLLDQIIIEVNSRENVTTVAKLIRRAIALSHNNVLDYSLVVPLELLSQSLATQRIFNLMLVIIGGISLLVGGIGIMNIMLATVTERKREIGIRRAVGATQKDIAYQFLAESLLLTICGGLIGIGAGFICVNFVENMTGWPIVITGWAMFLPFFLACLTGIFFGLYPAMQAAKVDPIQALRAV